MPTAREPRKPSASVFNAPAILLRPCSTNNPPRTATIQETSGGGSGLKRKKAPNFCSPVETESTASEGSSENHDKLDESGGSSISTPSTSGSTESSAESEPLENSEPVDLVIKTPTPPEILPPKKQDMQPQQFPKPQAVRTQDDRQKPTQQQAPRIKDLRIDTAGRVASVLPVPPVGPPPNYFARPSREASSSQTKDADSRSQFSVASLAAPLLPASAASLANRGAMEQASLVDIISIRAAHFPLR
ncbi:hypothetical protein HPB51_000973 [Rhipicephalus microplus]|uniref:Uncharacterized protein n=1 Tax=Rhipicephalus microplus TaxID=6941 RepID=A0A9J6DDX4_RHIMP|nr:hypothetical protein HPB51_029340 [Rhipicephalus microplus]KAH8020340.1 hypothetical protein HPB51_000973 [Rhipicephalus microplus]